MSLVLRVLEVRTREQFGDPLTIVGFGDIKKIIQLHSTKVQPLSEEDDIREIHTQEIAEPLATLLETVTHREPVLAALFGALNLGYQTAELVRQNRVQDFK